MTAKPVPSIGKPKRKLRPPQVAVIIKQSRIVPPKDLSRTSRFFDPWLISKRPELIRAAETLAFHYLQAKPRVRRLKEHDRKNLETVSRAVIANLACSVLLGVNPPEVSVSLRNASVKTTRYIRPGFALLPSFIKQLSETASPFFDLRKSSQIGVASRITATPKLAENLTDIELRPDDFEWVRSSELIYLSRTSNSRFDEPRVTEPVDYQDTAETRRLSQEMALINDHLAHAEISFEQDGSKAVLTNQRQLTRYFKLLAHDIDPHFDLGGRLYGGWWTNLKKERRPGIRIDGEPIADLDFASMFLRLAYIRVGLEPPHGDLYAAIPGYSDGKSRPALKVVANAMFFIDASYAGNWVMASIRRRGLKGCR